MNFFSNHPTDKILEGVLSGERITFSDALLLYKEGDFLKIQAVAREIRRRKNPPKEITYTIFQMVNYTTFCNVDCSFCSFYESYDSPRGKRLTSDEIIEKMRGAIKQGADQMFLQGGVDENISFDYYIEVLRKVKKELGANIHIRAFSPVELLGMEKKTGLPLERVLERLKEAGLDSVPGAGAEILNERVRKILSPKKASSSEWVRAMETCHNVGLKGSANIVFGSEETQEEVIEHLQLVRDLQDRTNGFLSFIPWTFQQQTKLFHVRKVNTKEFIKVLGLCRIFLDNIPHIETSLMVLGASVGSLALEAGADDISSVVLEENVLKSFGMKNEEQAQEFIRWTGYEAVRRDLLYNTDKYRR